MSFYSGGEIKTEYIDPVIDIANNRTEFRLNNYEAVLTNLRLGNVGLTGVAGKYNGILGSYGCIKNIKLMNGQTELSSCRNANLWLGFKNLLNPNSVNESVGQVVKNNGIGFFVKGTTNTMGEQRNAFDDINTTTASTQHGHLDLRIILPLLNSVQSLNNTLFPQLKLVIEWENDRRIMTTKDTNNYTTETPILIVDVIQDEGVKNNSMANFPSQVLFQEIEHDEFIIPAVAVSATTTHLEQSSSFKVNGFNNKSLGRLVMMKHDATPANLVSNTGNVAGFGNVGSLAQHKEVINWSVNGRPLLTGAGLSGNSQRLSMLCDTWGSLNLIPNGNINGGRSVAFVKDGANRCGQLDYSGVYVDESINDLQLNYKRTGIYSSTGQNQINNSLRVHVFGEVSKVMNVKNGEFNISYV